MLWKVEYSKWRRLYFFEMWALEQMIVLQRELRRRLLLMHEPLLGLFYDKDVFIRYSMVDCYVETRNLLLSAHQLAS